MSTTAGGSGDSDYEEGEVQDISSETRKVSGVLNVNNKNETTENELSAFRQQWQQELGLNTSPQSLIEESYQESKPLTDEEKAKQLFMQGADLEKSGKLYEAIQYYKRAMQIEPDIEIKLYQSIELHPASSEDESETEEMTRVEEEHPSDDEDAVEGEDLLMRLQRIVAKKGFYCTPEYPPRGAHISWLPLEVLLLIFRWVVSSDLDAISLERVSATCRGLYVAARDFDIWRGLCVKTWGIDCGIPRTSGYSSWRQMYIERPRLHLHGCYISKTTYIRHGENSFQDQFYRPLYLVDYYRYLRFFPDGTVLSWTTAEEPAACVGHLKHRIANGKHERGIMAGHYRLIGNKVAIVIKKTSNERKPAQAANTRFRSRRRETHHEHHEQIFHLELELRTVRSKRNWQLVWCGYSVSTRRDQWTQFELTPNKFPPFAFSRVRNYTAESHAPLQLAL